MSERTRLQPLTIDSSLLDLNQKIYLAKLLNGKISQIIRTFHEINKISIIIKLLSVDLSFSLDELNDLYVNIVDIIERLYEVDVSFKDIVATPIWKRVKILYGYEEVLDNKTFMVEHKRHCSEIERRWILVGKPEVALTYQMYVWIESTERTLFSYWREIEILQGKEKQFLPNPDEILFAIKYKSMQCELSINNVFIQKVRTDFVLDRFLSKAQKNPAKRTYVEGHGLNLPKAIGNIKMPKLLKDLFFEGRSSNSCVFNPTITRRRLLESGASLGEIEELLRRYPS